MNFDINPLIEMFIFSMSLFIPESMSKMQKMFRKFNYIFLLLFHCNQRYVLYKLRLNKFFHYRLNTSSIKQHHLFTMMLLHSTVYSISILKYLLILRLYFPG